MTSVDLKSSEKKCERCGNVLTKGHRRYCANPACKRYGDLIKKKKMREQSKLLGETRRKVKEITPKGHPERKCQYPPGAAHKCGRSLANTANYFFCKEHAAKIHQ